MISEIFTCVLLLVTLFGTCQGLNCYDQSQGLANIPEKGRRVLSWRGEAEKHTAVQSCSSERLCATLDCEFDGKPAFARGCWSFRERTLKEFERMYCSAPGPSLCAEMKRFSASCRLSTCKRNLCNKDVRPPSPRTTSSPMQAETDSSDAELTENAAGHMATAGGLSIGIAVVLLMLNSIMWH